MVRAETWGVHRLLGRAAGLWGLVALVACGGTVPPQGALDAQGAATEVAPPPSLGLTRGVGDEADTWLAQGERDYIGKDLDAAAQAFQRARQLLPRHPAPVVGAVMVELERAKAGYEFASRRGDAEVLRLQAELAAADAASDFAPWWYQRGRVALLLGDAEAARSALQRAAELTPEDAKVHGALGVAFLALGDPAGAVLGLQRAVDLEPDNAALWTNLGAAFMMSERPEQAREAYRRAVELAPSSARAHSDLGTTLIALGQARAALGELEEAHRLAPERPTIMNNLGYALQSLGEWSSAEAWYQQALARDPSLGAAWVNLGVVRAKQRRFDEARAAFERALELDPEDPRALVNLEELGREQAATEADVAR